MPFTLKLAIHATPGARHTEVAGAHGGALRVRLAAPPIDGKANAALIAWAAQAFGVPRSAVRLLAGDSARQKLLGLRFGSEADVATARDQVARWMSDSSAS